MLSKDCKKCKWVIWMVGIGQGVRCNHPQNEHFNKHDPKYKKDGIQKPIISCIPNGCTFEKEGKNAQ